MKKQQKTLCLYVLMVAAMFCLVLASCTPTCKEHTPGPEPTCTTSQKCTVCSAVIAPAKGHTPGEAATCTHAQTCTVCSAIIAPAVPHTPGAVATCTTPQTCVVCKNVLALVLPHTPGPVATCTTPQTCTVCSRVLNAVLPHTPGDEATCTAPKTCVVCQTVLAPTIAHTPGSAATCTAAQVCTVCASVLHEMLAHTPGAEATCTAAQLCTVCSSELNEKLPHTPGDEPSCTEGQLCTVCQNELLPALGHTPGEPAGCETPEVCTVCSATTTFPLGHTTTDGVCKNCGRVFVDGAEAAPVTIDEVVYYLLDNPDYAVLAGVEAVGATFVAPTAVTSGGKTYPVTHIMTRAFYGNEEITHIEIPNGITNIGEEAFAWCSNLERVDIAETVTQIGRYAFYGDDKLTVYARRQDVPEGYDEFWNVRVNHADADYETVPVIYGVNVEVTVGGVRYMVGQNGATAIGCAAPLVNLEIPSTITNEGETYAVTSIGEHAFTNCQTLESVVIGEYVETIYYRAFYGLGQLAAVTLGAGVKEIQTEAFGNAGGITEVIIPTSVEKLGERVFASEGEEELFIYHLGTAAKEGYHERWNYLYYDSATNFAVATTVFGYLGKTTVDNTIYGITQDGAKVLQYLGDGGELELGNTVLFEGTEYPLTAIKERAFYNGELTSIVIPLSVVSIGEAAFFGSPGLVIYHMAASPQAGYHARWNYEYYESATNYGVYQTHYGYVGQLQNAGIHYVVTENGAKVAGTDGVSEHYELPNHITFDGIVYSVSEILSFAFANQESLLSVLIPISVQTIGGMVFQNSPNVEIRHRGGVDKMGYHAYWNYIRYESDTEYQKAPVVYRFVDYLQNGNQRYLLQFDGATLVKYDGEEANLEIPAQLRHLAENYPVVKIGARAFYNRTALQTITIPDSVLSIGEMAFEGCALLTIQNKADEAKEGYHACWNCLSHDDPQEIPVVYQYITNMTSGSFSYRVTKKGATLLKQTGGTGDMVIPASLTHNGTSYAVKEIVPNAMYGRTGMKSYVIPDTVETIGALAFGGMAGLQIRCKGDTAKEGYHAMWNYEYYHSETDNKEIATIYRFVVIKTESNLQFFVTKDGAKVTGLVSGTSVTIPESLTHEAVAYPVNEIATQAFLNKTTLVSLTVPESVEVIGAMAFEGCTKLTVYLKGLTAKEGYHERWRYQSYTSETENKEIPFVFGFVVDKTEAGVRYLVTQTDTTVMSYSPSATTVNILNTVLHNGVNYPVTKIAANAFLNRTTIKTVSLPSGLIEIGARAFEGCKVLTEVSFGDALQKIGSNAFKGCVELLQVVLPTTLTEIDSLPFEGCTKLTIFSKATAAGGGYHSTWYYSKFVDETDYVKIDIHFAFVGFLQDVGDYSYQIFQSGASIMSYSGAGGTIELPDSVTYGEQSYPIIGIAKEAFKAKTELINVSIPASVLTIGAGAFEGCTYLSAVHLPTLLRALPDSLFKGCSRLESVEMGNSIVTMGKNVFQSCALLTAIRLSTELQNIGENAFRSCTNLVSITIPDSVKTLDAYAFSDCSKLATVNLGTGVEELKSYAIYKTAIAEITLPSGLKRIGDYALANNNNLTSLVIPDSVEILDNYSLRANESMTELVIGNGVKVIGTNALYACKKLTSVTMGTAVEEIHDRAFGNLTELTELAIPNSLERFEGRPFINSSKLNLFVEAMEDKEGFGLQWNAKSYSSETSYSLLPVIYGFRGFYTDEQGLDFAMSAADATTVLRYRGTSISVTVPQTVGEDAYPVRVIKESAFSEKNTLKTITLPEGLLRIEKNAFYRCYALTSFTVPNTVETIEDMVFNGCGSLETVNLGAGLVSLGAEVFFNSNRVQSLTFGPMLQFLNLRFADGMLGVKELIVHPDNPYFSSELGLLFNKDKTKLIMYPKNKQLDTYTVPSTVTTIGADAFSSAQLGEIIVPDSVTTLETMAFRNAKLIRAVLGNGITVIPNTTFFGNNQLVSVTLGSQVESIGREAFWNCTALETINIPATVREIPYRAFWQCRKLSDIGSGLMGLETLGMEAFASCNALKTVTIGANLVEFGKNAFQGSGLTSLTILATTPPEFANFTAQEIPSSCNIYVPAAALADYITTPGWMTYAGKIAPIPTE